MPVYTMRVYTLHGAVTVKFQAPNEYAAFDIARHNFGEPLTMPRLSKRVSA